MIPTSQSALLVGYLVYFEFGYYDLVKIFLNLEHNFEGFWHSVILVY